MRVVVAMSGGVDSSVVAGLLHEAGHEVIGVTLQLYDHGAASGRKGACCAGQDIHDARRVADRLGIPHYIIDAEERFARAVIATSPTAMPVAKHRCPASAAIRRSSSPTCPSWRATWVRNGSPPATTSVASMDRMGPNCTEQPIPRGTKAGFCSQRRASSLDLCLFPLGGMQDKRAVRDVAQRLGPARRRKAGQPGHLFRADRCLYGRRGQDSGPMR